MSLSDDVFEIKTKYHNFIVILLILTHILSYQDDFIVRSLLLPLFPKVVGWFWMISLCFVENLTIVIEVVWAFSPCLSWSTVIGVLRLVFPVITATFSGTNVFHSSTSGDHESLRRRS